MSEELREEVTIVDQIMRGGPLIKSKVRQTIFEELPTNVFLYASKNQDQLLTRYNNWRLLTQEGFHDYLPAFMTAPFKIEDSRLPSYVILAEDFETSGWEVFDYEFGINKVNGATISASRFIKNTIGSLNAIPDIFEGQINTFPYLVQEELRRMYAYYIVELGRDCLPTFDPMLERQGRELADKLVENGWTAPTDAYFILTRFSNNESWPFDRRIVIGDLDGVLGKKNIPVVSPRGAIADCLSAVCSY